MLRKEITDDDEEEYSKSSKLKFRNKISHDSEDAVVVTDIYVPKSLQSNSEEVLKYIPSSKSRKTGNY